MIDKQIDSSQPLCMETAERHENCGICPTRGLCAARGLVQTELETLSGRVATTPPMAKSQFLYRTGDPATCWFVVRSGVYKTTTVTSDGEEYITGFHYPGELLGMEGAASGTFSESATALVSATACGLDLADLPELWVLGGNHAILRLIAEHEKNQRLLRINLSQSRAEVRIAGFIKLLMDRCGRQGFDSTCLHTPMSRTDLANHLGLTLECVSRILSKWRKAGVIDTDRSTMKILKPGELATHTFHLAA